MSSLTSRTYILVDVPTVLPLLTEEGRQQLLSARFNLAGTRAVKNLNHSEDAILACFVNQSAKELAFEVSQLLTFAEFEELLATEEWSNFEPEQGEA